MDKWGLCMKRELAVFFDLDKTIVGCSTEKVFALYLFRKGILGWRKLFNIIFNYIKYDFHIIKNYDDVKSKIISEIVKDIRVGYYEEIFKEYFDKELKKRIYPEILDIIDKHKNDGHKVYIISAALALIVKQFAEILEVDGYFATELEKENDKYNGNISGMIHYGNNKAIKIKEVALKKNIDLQKSFAYGDYFEDCHMLQNVGFPIAINPDKKLKSIAKERNWEIRHIVN